MKKVIVNKQEKFYWEKGDMHTKNGVFKEKDIIDKDIIDTKNGKFTVLESNFLDKIEKIQRGPAIMVKKDIGSILANVDINKDSIVVDAGAGCGVLSSFLSRHVKKVIAYENNPEFFKIASRNIEFLDIKNIQLKEKDIYQGIDERNLDLVTLDLKEPSLVLKHAQVSLKKSKYLVAYLPNISQVIALVRETDGFFTERIIETIERDWIIDEKRARPKNIILGHTGFLVFLRKI
ncbi:methyltransferase [Candidatus Woesearchaeota archaeon]|nr:methyltransferase [Candidatus Woesearchaeota archaeon]